MAEGSTSEAPAADAPKAPAARSKTVILATDHAHTFESAGAVVTHEGTEVTQDQADEIMTAAMKMRINITVKEA